MKKTLTLILSVITILSLGSIDNSYSQNTPKEQRQKVRTLKVKDKQLESQIKEKALVEARKEAKTLTKQGFKNATGALPVDKQIEQSWKYAYDTDADGNRLYIIATQTAVGGNYSAAKAQAMSLAKVELAGQIATQVGEFVKNEINNENLGQDEVATLVSTVSASKTKIEQQLGRVIPVVEISRVLPNKNIEMHVTLAYNTKNALGIIKGIVKEELKGKSSKLAEQVDTLF